MDISISKVQSIIEFPVGYHRFHKDQLFNYQLNRWYSFGYTRFGDMRIAGSRILSFPEWKKVLIGLALDYEWEKPVAAVLDYFNADDVTLLGVSMCGYFCFRAAAFKSRVKRVIASGIAFDYMKFPNIFERWIMHLFFTHFRNFSDKVTLKKMKKDGMHKWSIENLMYITRKNTPMEAFDVAAQLNEKNLHSEKVIQDVLILTGRDDHFVPFKMHDMQVRALTGARSVTGKIFTKKDHAQNHCQIGNIRLALDVMINWIEKLS